MNDEKIYQRIGEFVVCFQFLEDQIRQIGWLLLDPGRKVWPPQALRNLMADALTKEVAQLYEDKLHLCRLPDEQERRVEFAELLRKFHELRRFRNRVLHSAYNEIKGGGQVLAIMRSNPKVMTDPDTGENDAPYSGPSSGTLKCIGGPVPPNAEYFFPGMPPGNLQLDLDGKPWDARLVPGNGQTQDLILINRSSGPQKGCTVRWRIIP